VVSLAKDESVADLPDAQAFFAPVNTALAASASRDLLGLMLLDAEPARRGLLVQRTEADITYGAFPPDFDLRVQRLFAPASAPR